MPKRHSPGSRAGVIGSAPLFAALGDANRLRLVSRLFRSGPMSITSLAAGSNVTRQAITKHLHVMERAGLVRGMRRGRERIWQLDQRRLAQAQRDLEQISKRWDEALARLRTMVENEGRPSEDKA